MAIENFRIPADLVSILDESGNQVFELAIPMKVAVDPGIQYMRNPIDSGATITDHYIILPVVASIDFIVTNSNYREAYQQIRTAARAAQRFTVQTKSDTFQNMYIENYPSEEDPDKFDAITITISFIEIQLDTATLELLPASQVSDASDASTTDRGEVSGSATSGSLFSQAANALGVIS